MKKKLALIMTTMQVGGTEKVLIEMLDAIDYNCYDVDLWLQGTGPLDYLVNPNVHIKFWGNDNSEKVVKKLLSDGKIWNICKSAFYWLLARIHFQDWVFNGLYMAKMQCPCTDMVYDCVIAYQGLSPLVVATALYRFDAPKKIAWIHGSDAFQQCHVKIIEKEYGKLDRIFCVSNALKKEFSSKYRKLDKKTDVFYNLLNQQDIMTKAEEPIIEELRPVSLVTVGRLSAEKGQQMIPQTARLLLDAGYDIHWYLVGDGALRDNIEQECRKQDVCDRVILLGTRQNPYPYIKQCDIYVQPSFTEGYCTTTMEAKVLSKPIVTTDAPGMQEQIISGESGLIVDAMTPEAIADGIKLLLDHPEMMEKFRENLKCELPDHHAELQKLYDLI